jgi:hypothetical protein
LCYSRSSLILPSTAKLAGEHEIVVAGKALALPELSERLRDVWRHRNGADSSRLRHRQRTSRVARAQAYRCAFEVDVSPSKCQQFAAAQPGERGGQEDGSVPLRLCRPHQGENLFHAEDLDVAVRALAVALDVEHWVPGDPIDLLSTAEDPVELDQELVFRAGRQLRRKRGTPSLDRRRVDVLDGYRAERREQVADDR